MLLVGNSISRSDGWTCALKWGKMMCACNFLKRSRPHMPSYEEEAESRTSNDCLKS